jgi:hypothetical protein
MNVVPCDKQIEVIAALCDGLGVRASPSRSYCSHAVTEAVFQLIRPFRCFGAGCFLSRGRSPTLTQPTPQAKAKDASTSSAAHSLRMRTYTMKALPRGNRVKIALTWRPMSRDESQLRVIRIVASATAPVR